MIFRISLLAIAFCLLPAVRAEDDAANADARRNLYLYLQGREIYQEQCLPCHGARGRGDGPWSKNLTKDRPRNFRTGVFKFRSTPMGFLPTDEDLVHTVKRGITGTSMPTFKNHLSDEEIEAVLVFVKSFSRNWKDETKHTEPLTLPEAPEWFRKPDARTTHQKQGRDLFAAHCSSCHGPSGKGNGPAAGSLKDIWGFDIAPADLSAEHHKSGDAPADLFRTIYLGLDGTPMVGFRGLLSEPQIWNLVAYIKSLEV